MNDFNTPSIPQFAALVPTPRAPQATGRSWSPYQDAIFDTFVNGSGNVVVEAVAGSGKTTTMIEGLKRWCAGNRGKKAVFIAFNKAIAEELARKVPAGVDAKTLHSACFGAIRRRFGKVELDNYKIDDTAKEIISQHDEIEISMRAKVASDLKRGYGILKGTLTDVADVQACNEALAAYDVTLDFPGTSVGLMAELDKHMIANTTRITFDEMLSFIIDHDIAPATYDLVCVDESQDMNLMQIAILKRMVRLGGRFIAVGDTFQSIYGFRGADSEAMNRIRSDFKVPAKNELPLSITYRCPTSVVEMAQKYVPHIQAAPNAPEGIVMTCEATQESFDETIREMAPGDMGICRANAPLIACALSLIAEGRRAQIKGRDIGLSITKLMKDLLKKCSSQTVNSLSSAVVIYQARQVEKLRMQRKDSQAASVEDRCETLLAILKGADSLEEVDDRIDRLFSDSVGAGAVLFSSGHKSKGLESDKVVWIGPEISGWILKKIKTDAGKQQEANISYVIITRAKKTLVIQPLPAREKKEEE